MLAARPVVEGRAAGQQPIEHHAEGVNVRGRGNRTTANLFRTRIFGRHCLQHRRRANRRGRQDLCNPEVEELRGALRGHQDVAGFDVAMYDQVTVGVLHSRAHLAEQPQSRLDVELVPIAELIDRHARHQLHCDIRDPVVGRAAIEQARNVGMIETGQDLALVAKSFQQQRDAGAAANQLDRHLLRVEAVSSRRQVDFAHPAAADLPHQTVVAYLESRAQAFGRIGVVRARAHDGRGLEKPALCVFMGTQQGRHLCMEIRILATQ